MSDDLEWARHLVERGAVVMHLPTNVIGKAVRLHDAEHPYQPEPERRPVTAPVLELEPGHTFVAKADAFIELTPREARLYEHVRLALHQSMIESMRVAAAMQIQPRTAITVVVSALRTQGAMLEAGGRPEKAADE
jgi:hypothetical protein